jgi:hypothetical protein
LPKPAAWGLEVIRATREAESKMSAGASGAKPIREPRLSIEKSAPLPLQPFWRRKAEVARKMREERAVVVSVKAADVAQPAGFVSFSISGAGVVARKKETAFRLAQDYSRLREVSDHFRVVNWNSRDSQLFVVTEALGYEARMLMDVRAIDADWRSEIQWEVIGGHFKGMTGVFGFETLPNGNTEVSIQSIYKAKELPLPRALVGFALEVVTQKVAEKMRTFLESKNPSSQPSLVMPPPAGGETSVPAKKDI